MISRRATALAQAAGLGAVAGIRTMSAPALLSHHLKSEQLDGDNDLEGNPLASPNAAAVFRVLAAGEIIADKLPFMPDRTSLPSLMARIGSGALVGGTVFAARKEPPVVGAIIGAAAAVASAFTMLFLRRKAGRNLNLPDPVVALAEDAIAIGGGMGVLKSGRQSLHKYSD
ncbi:MAG TPA: DUF4126 family protein [Blastocatellia bacterium]|nr:DUF4126 family protein [Blastocatellia bacterium]